jgi:hypothetical protein
MGGLLPSSQTAMCSAVQSQCGGDVKIFYILFKERMSIESAFVSKYQPCHAIANSSFFLTHATALRAVNFGRRRGDHGARCSELRVKASGAPHFLASAAEVAARTSAGGRRTRSREKGAAGIVVALKESTMSGPGTLVSSRCRLCLVMAESNMSRLQGPVASFDLTLALSNHAAPSEAPPTAASPSSDNDAFVPDNLMCTALAVPKSYSAV